MELIFVKADSEVYEGREYRRQEGLEHGIKTAMYREIEEEEKSNHFWETVCTTDKRKRK